MIQQVGEPAHARLPQKMRSSRSPRSKDPTSARKMVKDLRICSSGEGRLELDFNRKTGLVMVELRNKKFTLQEKN
jgi:hypothetical protein